MQIAALYARVSTSNQQQNETIASQLDALMAYAHAHDYEISPHHIYQDEETIASLPGFGMAPEGHLS